MGSELGDLVGGGGGGGGGAAGNVGSPLRKRKRKFTILFWENLYEFYSLLLDKNKDK